MAKEYYVDETNLVILKKEDGLIYQYSFTEKRWYGVPELQGFLDHLDLLKKVSEKQVQTLINNIDEFIEKNKSKKGRKY